MALAPLASVADLLSRDVSQELLARGYADADLALALDVASSAVRDAAEASISAVTGTVTVPAPDGKLLPLPGPVTAVTAVAVDGSAVTDYQNVGTGLWRRCGWSCDPVPVAVTGTFGLATVPVDIVDLTCSLAKAWLDHQSAGGGSVAGLTSAAVDDARETYSDEAAGQVSPVFIPEKTRLWLSRRFGGGGSVVVGTL